MSPTAHEAAAHGERAPMTMVNDCPGIQLLRFERELTDDEHEAYLEGATRDMASIREGARIVMIIDVNNAGRGSSVQRRRQAEWQSEHTDYFKRYVIAGVFVARSLLVRGALRAVAWFKPYPYDTEITSDIDDAIDAAISLLLREGLPVPTELQLLLLRQIY